MQAMRGGGADRSGPLAAFKAGEFLADILYSNMSEGSFLLKKGSVQINKQRKRQENAIEEGEEGARRLER